MQLWVLLLHDHCESLFYLHQYFAACEHVRCLSLGKLQIMQKVCRKNGAIQTFLNMIIICIKPNYRNFKSCLSIDRQLLYKIQDLFDLYSNQFYMQFAPVSFIRISIAIDVISSIPTIAHMWGWKLFMLSKLNFLYLWE